MLNRLHCVLCETHQQATKIMVPDKQHPTNGVASTIPDLNPIENLWADIKMLFMFKIKKCRRIVECSAINLACNTCWPLPDFIWLHALQIRSSYQKPWLCNKILDKVAQQNWVFKNFLVCTQHFDFRYQCHFFNITVLHFLWNIIKCYYFSQFSCFEIECSVNVQCLQFIWRILTYTRLC